MSSRPSSSSKNAVPEKRPESAAKHAAQASEKRPESAAKNAEKRPESAAKNSASAAGATAVVIGPRERKQEGPKHAHAYS